jgi:hypothetical protein
VCPGDCSDFCTDGCCSASETIAICPEDCPGTGDCCEVQTSAGCEDTAIQSCVCDGDSQCCSDQWDSDCVDEVEIFACGTCDADVDTDTDTDTDTDADTDTDTDSETDTETGPDVLFAEDWEDGVWDDTWIAGGGVYTREVTDATAADGTAQSLHLVGSELTDHSDGIHAVVGVLQPSEISYWARSGSTGVNDTYFVLNQGETSNLLHEVAFIYFRSTGYIHIAGPGINLQTYAADTWYQIELRDIDWTGKHYDVWVDGLLRATDVPFRDTSKTSIGRIDLYNYQDSEAWWDEIVFHE